MTTTLGASGRSAAKAPSRRGDSGAHRIANAAAAEAAPAAPVAGDGGAVGAPSTTDDAGPRDPDDTMNVDAIKQILDLVREHELTEFELEQAGVKLRVKKQGAAVAVPAPLQPVMPAPVAMAPAPAAAAAPVAAAAPPAAAPAEPLELSVVTSPIVGTFYRSPDPSSPAFVEVGQRVKKGQTLCIIEAMKLMNEIESEYEGEVVKVYVENGQPVQYGERLFAVKTT
jgi:acetyl-CoA carboxylase biotin carboxyl carrier protein